MSRRTRVSTAGLLARHLASGAGTSILVAVLIFATVLVVALAPRALAAMGTRELHYRVDALSPLMRDLTVVGNLGAEPGLSQAETTADVFGAIDPALTRFAESTERPLSAMLGEPQWAAFSPRRTVQRAGETNRIVPIVGVAVDLRYEERIQIVDGRLPEPWDGDELDDAEPADRPPIEFVLPTQSADLMEIAIGDVVDWIPASLVLVGTYDAVDGADPYWLQVPELIRATEEYTASGHFATGAGFLNPGSGVGMWPTFQNSTLRAWYPLSAAGVEFADASTVLDQVQAASALGMRVNGHEQTVRTGVSSTIQSVIGAVAAVSALLALAASGPLGVLLAVYAIAVQSVIRRRSRTLALASARGAGPLQLRGAMAGEGLLLGLPAAALAVLVAGIVLPVPVGPDALVLPALLGLLPAVLAAVNASPRVFRAQRDSEHRAGARRWLAEAIVAGLAALSLFLLFRRGLVDTSAALGGIDPLLAATPMLLAIAVCLVALRILPIPLRGIARLARTGRGAIGMLGAARAVRDPALGFTATLALLVGIGVAVFSAVLATSVDDALRDVAAEEVGADLQVRAPQLGTEVQEAVAAAPGVASVAPVGSAERERLVLGRLATDLRVLFTDTEALAAQRPGLPDGLTDDAGGVPLLLSSGLESYAGNATGTVDGVPIRVAGVLPESSMPGVDGAWVLIDDRFASRFTERTPTIGRLLVGAQSGVALPSLGDALRTVVAEAQRPSDVPLVSVLDRTTRLAEKEATPVVEGVRTALLISTTAALALSMLTVVLASIAAAAARHRIVGVLRVLGTTNRALRALLAWELAPVALVAIVAGTGLGLALPWIVTAAVDLRPFVGGSIVPTPVVDPLVIAGVVAGFALAVLLAGAVAVAIGRRRDPNATLRMGAE